MAGGPGCPALCKLRSLTKSPPSQSYIQRAAGDKQRLVSDGDKYDDGGEWTRAGVRNDRDASDR